MFLTPSDFHATTAMYPSAFPSTFAVKSKVKVVSFVKFPAADSTPIVSSFTTTVDVMLSNARNVGDCQIGEPVDAICRRVYACPVTRALSAL